MKKSDLQQIKKVIEEVALTKKDAKSFATKDDLKEIRRDMSRFATKDDLIGLARGVEIDNLKIEFLDKLEQWKNELYNKIDPILGRVKKAEEENTILKAREEARLEIKEDLEKKIKKLEDIHPNFQHSS